MLLKVHNSWTYNTYIQQPGLRDLLKRVLVIKHKNPFSSFFVGRISVELVVAVISFAIVHLFNISI